MWLWDQGREKIIPILPAQKHYSNIEYSSNYNFTQKLK